MDQRIRSKFLAFARGSVLFAVVLSPWLFGSAEPWAYLSVCLVVNAGVAVWLLALIAGPQTRLCAPAVLLILVALLAFTAFQTVPIRRSLAKTIGPLAAETRLAQGQAFETAGLGDFLPPDVSDDPDVATISASAAATWRALFLLAAYVGTFLVMAHAFDKWQQLRAAAIVIVVSSALMAVVGMVHKYSGSGTILWFHTPRFGGTIFGPFTNPNHYAAHMNMAFGVGLGLLLATSGAGAREVSRTWRESLTRLTTGKVGIVPLLGFGVVLMGASVFVSLSRAGMAALAGSLALLAAFTVARRGLSHPGRVVGTVAVLVAAAVVWLGWAPVVQELGTLADAVGPIRGSRVEAAQATLRIFKEYPLTGCGFGTFRHVFPAFQSPSVQFGRWTHAHNDYAQLLAEGGIIGASLVALAGVSFVWAIGRRFPGAGSRGRLMVLGLSVSIVSVALHSFVDYGLHKPANAFLLACICGMCLAAVHMKGKQTKRSARQGQEHDFDEGSRQSVAPTG